MLLVILAFCGCCIKSPDRRGAERVEVIEERYVRRRSRSPRTHTGWFGGGRQPSGSDSDEVIVIEERLPSRRRSGTRRPSLYSRPSPSIFARWNTVLGLGPRRRTETIIAERYSRRRSISPIRRRDADGERRSTGLKRIYAWFIAWFIAPLLLIFGIARRAPDRRPSRSSSLSYASSASTRTRSSNASSERRSRRYRR
jgi:hypothetical protein